MKYAVVSVCAVQVLAMGNVTAAEAASLAATVADFATPPAGLPAALWPTERIVRLPNGGAPSACRLPRPVPPHLTFDPQPGRAPSQNWHDGKS